MELSFMLHNSEHNYWILKLTNQVIQKYIKLKNEAKLSNLKVIFESSNH